MSKNLREAIALWQAVLLAMIVMGLSSMIGMSIHAQIDPPTPTPTATSVLTPTPTGTSAPTLTPTGTSVPTPTPTVTSAPTATPTGTSAPTAIPTSFPANPIYDAYLVKDIKQGPDGSFPYSLTEFNGQVYFTADEARYGREIWRSDGTEAGTTILKDIFTGEIGSEPHSLAVWNGLLLFSAVDATHGRELLKSDGTREGTLLVKDINPLDSSWSGTGSAIGSMTATRDFLYFAASSSGDALVSELWRTDGTEAGTVRVAPVDVDSEIVEINGTLLFVVNSSEGQELWKSDGTEQGTRLVYDIYPGTCRQSYPCSSRPNQLTKMNNRLYFSAFDGSHGYELWRSDGTEAGTVLVKDICPGVNGWGSTQMLEINGTLFFDADDCVHGRELWKSNGTSAGTMMVADIHPDGESSPVALTNVNGVLFFYADVGDGYRLWKSDGTSAGTVMVADVPILYSSEFEEGLPAVLGDYIFFVADDGLSGAELWISDGTTEGTQMVEDIRPGREGSIPTNLTVINETLFFAASSSGLGTELWSLAKGTETIQVGDTISGAIDTPGTVAQYQFAAASGQQILLDVQEPAPGSTWTVQLTDPGGDLVFDTAFADSGPHTLAKAGIYTLTIDPHGTTGAFRFRLQDATAEPNLIPIQIGDEISGNFDEIGEIDRYEFTASSGEQIYFNALEPEIEGSIHVRLTDSQGSDLVDDHFKNNGPFTLQQGSTYILRISAQGGYTGTYRFKIWRVPPPDRFTIQIGDTVPESLGSNGAGNLESFGVVDEYSFVAEDGQQIYFSALEDNVPNPRVQLKDSLGNTVFEHGFSSSGPHRLPRDGIYTLRVSAPNDQTGTYRFQIYDTGPTTDPISEDNDAANDACATAPELDLGRRYEGTISSASDVDHFRVHVSEPNLLLTVKLVAPDGTDYDVTVLTNCTADGGRGRHVGRARHVGEENQQVAALRLGPNTGDYFIRIRGTDNAISSQPYQLTVTLSPVAPTRIGTLFLVNRERMRQHYDADDINRLMVTLYELAGRQDVEGVIFHLENEVDLQATYAQWDGRPTDVATANAVADSIKGLIRNYLQEYPERNNIVLVGDDRIIPHYRIDIAPPVGSLDTSWQPESAYNGGVEPTTALGAALARNFTLTDDYYVDFTPAPWDGGLLHIPDLALGRLVETPAEIQTTLTAFMEQDGQIEVASALVTGYDFGVDGAQAYCNILEQLLGANRIDCTLVVGAQGSRWNADALLTRWKDLSSPHVASLFNHANHWEYESAAGDALAASSAKSVAGLYGSLVYVIGCQAGLNVTAGNQPVDWAQTLIGQGATYIASTGWAYGVDGEIGYMEKLMSLLTQQLDDNLTVGEALRQAKILYGLEIPGMGTDRNQASYYDAKTLAAATLYGLPMWRIRLDAAPPSVQRSNDAEEPATVYTHPSTIAATASEPADGRAWLADRSMPPGLIAEVRTVEGIAHTQHDVATGRYYSIDTNVGKGIRLQANAPIQPQAQTTFIEELGEPRGVFFEGGTYEDLPLNNPVIVRARFTNDGEVGAEPDYGGNRWYPELPVEMSRVHFLDGTVEAWQISRLTGQYHAEQQIQRLYKELQHRTYLLNTSQAPEHIVEDRTPPTIGQPNHQEQTQGVQIAVTVSDASAVYRVGITWTDGNSRWQTTDLTQDGDTWRGVVSGKNAITYFIQAVDDAGNVAVNNRGGRYFNSDTALTAPIYLPFIHR